MLRQDSSDTGMYSPDNAPTEAPLDARIFSALVSSSDDGIIGTDVDGLILSWNAGAERLYGYSKDEMVGTHISSLMAVGLTRNPADVTQRIKNGEVVEAYQTQRTTKDGRVLWVSISVFPVKDYSGQVIGLAAISRDVTAQKAARTESDRLAAIVASLDDAIISTDVRGKIVSWNKGAERIFEYTAAEVTGQPLSTLAHVDDEDESRKSLSRAIRGESINHWRTNWVTKSGAVVPVSQTLSLIRDERGRITGVAGVVRDISAQMESRARLESQFVATEHARSEARAVLDAASDAMLLISPEQSILAVNRRFTELFEDGEPALTNGNFSDLRRAIPRIFEDPAGICQEMEDAVSYSTVSCRREIVQRWPVYRNLEMESHPVHLLDRRYIGQLFSFRDITRERESERTKNEFISMVSHELRTPLTSVKEYVDLIARGRVGELKERQQELLQVVQDNVDRLASLVDDLLDVSRVEAGQLDLEKTPVRLNGLVSKAVESFAQQFEAKRQTLKVEMRDSLPEVFCDPRRITQVITNLLSNAHKYTPEGGSVSIHLDEQEGRLIVRVTDTGIGLSADDSSQVFSRFFRAQSGRESHVGGTGLGLFITKSLVEMHGGEISVESALGQGSTFLFTLPVMREAEE